VLSFCFVFNYHTNIQPYFEFANFFKGIFKLFSKGADNQREKKQQLTRNWQNKSHRV
jgi:hypothetical protein